MKETNEIKVSVIIPVYNSESFIDQCLESVCEQSLTELEILCVDDDSTDDSAKIIKAWQNKDKRIRYIHQEHQFAGAARNTGLQEVTGKYVLFPDADDFIDKEMIHDLYDKAEETQADIVICGGYRYDDRTGEDSEQKSWLKTEYCPRDVFSPEELGDKLFYITNNAVWNKLFNRQFILDNHISFQTLHNTNDMFFTMLSLACADKIAYIDHPYIHYRVHISDSVQVRKKKHPMDFMMALDGLKKALMERGIFSEMKGAFDSLVKYVMRYNLVTIDDESRAMIADPLREHDLFKSMMADHSPDDPVIRRIRKLLKGVYFKKRSILHEDIEYLKNSHVSEPLCSTIICYPEDFDREVFDSILRQRTQNCEVILIGDCSDETLSVPEDERITVIKTVDQNKSCLRNIALAEAKGKYLYFAENKLCLAENVLEEMLNIMEENELEMLFIGNKDFKTKTMNGIDLVSALLDVKAFDDSLCFQMLSSSFMKKTRNAFHCGSSDDDAAFTLKNILCADKCAYLNIDSVPIGKDSADRSYDYQDLYDHFHSYLEMKDIIRRNETPLPENFLTLPYKEKEMAAAIYESLAEEERLDQETMDAYDRIVFNEEIIKPYRQNKQNDKKQKELEKKLNDTRSKLEILQNKQEKILQSRSYRFAMLLAWLPRKIRKLLGKDRNESRS